jgi:hypothetical protein
MPLLVTRVFVPEDDEVVELMQYADPEEEATQKRRRF